MIVSMGECLIDFTPFEENGRLVGFRLYPAGSPCNVAVGMGRLGYAAGFAGRLSRDFFGKILAEHLDSSDVDTTLLQTGDEPSPLAFVALDQDEPVYSFRIEGTAATQIRPEELQIDRFLRLEALHFGSISLLFEPSASSILALVRKLKGRVTLSFDPNLRPNLVTEWEPYRARLRECVALADLIKVSGADLEVWGESDPREWLADNGPVAVVVTRGPEGSRLYYQGGELECPAVPCRLVDTVGAGDAYTSGLLVSLAERHALSRAGMTELEPERWLEVMHFASTVAALTCEKPGADPPWRREVVARL
ncbi:MAG TPA: carbohydrate kinase [Chloroflexota bacterium]